MSQFFSSAAELKSYLDALPASKKGNFVPFDAAWYASEYMGNYQGTLTPFDHFFQIGAARGYAPNATFDPATYVSQYPDLQGFDSVDLLAHYLTFGLDEGRLGSSAMFGFDATRYLAENPDVAAYVNANLDQFGGSTENGARAHYIKFGMSEFRAAYTTAGTPISLNTAPATSPIQMVDLTGDGDADTLWLNTNGGKSLLVKGDAVVDGDDTGGVLRLAGDANVRIDMTNPANQLRGIDLNGDGVISNNGVENNVSGAGIVTVRDHIIIDAYPRNPLNELDSVGNFLGDITYSGTGFGGDGVSTNGNIVLGGLGVDNILGGIGNDFLVGGGVAGNVQSVIGRSVYDVYLGGTVVGDFLSGGRNADFFYGQFASVGNPDGVLTFFDGGSTADDTSAGGGESSQDSDWLLVEIADDEEYGEIVLNKNLFDEGVSSEDPSAGPKEGWGNEFGDETDFFAADGWVAIGDGKRLRGLLDDVENVDASGNLYGFLDGVNVQLGGRRMDDRDGDSAVNYGIGSSGQLRIFGSDSSNILIGGYDNDFIAGGGGADLLMGGNMQFFLETVAGGVTNPNLAGITNDGRDELVGGGGDDDIVFEADGGIYEGGSTYNSDSNYDDTDTLWLTKYLFGTSNAAAMTTDGVVRFDLLTGSEGGLENAAGYGGADKNAATGRYTADQTNYAAGVARTQVQDFGNIDATGLGSIDYKAAGANNPELDFTNQQNFWGYNGDMTLRGNWGDNRLYAGAGDDVLEGRHGNDDLMGGQGNDDFYFSIDGDTISGYRNGNGYGQEEFVSGGDGVDIIRRKVDANGDGLWDTDEDGEFVWGQDFGLDQDATVGQSVLRIRIEKVGGNASGDELDDVVNFVSEITTGVKDNGAFTSITLNTPAIRAATTYQGLVDAINAALDATAFGADLQASLASDGVEIRISDAKGRELADTIAEVAGAGVIVNQKANTQTQNLFQFGEPEVSIAQDRLIYKAYEDRADNEGVDDDAVTGSSVTLGRDAYAQDLVVSFSADGTRLAEDQAYALMFTNLTTEDVVKVEVNGVTYQLQVGVNVNGTQVDAEDGVNDSQSSIQAAFLQRFADFINSFMDDDTAAGSISASYQFDGQTIILTQNSYDGEETVFMNKPVVTLGNQSGGEPAKATVTNISQHEVHLFEFDGRDNALNSTNVLFWGQEMVNRAVLETAKDAGGTLNGSEALVINGGTLDDIVGIAHNLATDNELYTDADDDGFRDASERAAGNFAVHGDDYLIGGNGNDVINGLTGDDRIRGSLGNDTLDGGGDWYFVRRLGEAKGTAVVLNAYAAEQLKKNDTSILELYVIEQTESPDQMIQGDNFMPYFRDTLIYHQADFTPGVTRFTVTLNDFSGTGDDIVFANGGAGTFGVDANGDGTVEANNVSTFKNFENIRTVSGVGLAVAGPNGGQGRDTLNVAALSTAAEVGVRYDLVQNGGDVYLIEDTDNDLKTTGDQTVRQVIKVDGVENVIFGNGADVLNIDHTEAAKDNDITGGLGEDLVNYRNQFADIDDEPTVTINVGAAHGTAKDAGVDTVVMTEGRVGTVVATDTLRGIETIALLNNTAAGPRADDVLNVEALSAGATVNYINGKIYSDTDGDFDPADGVLQLTVNNLYQMEYVIADGADMVVVADGTVMNKNTEADSWSERADFLIDTYLTYDALDLRGAAPDRLSVGELRTINAGTANTADSGDIPENRNFSLFNFELGQGTDTVDYSAETGRIAAVVNFQDTDGVQYVMVDNNDSGGYRGPTDRIDRLKDVERVVASQGESILDVTSSGQDLEIKFLDWDSSGKERVASLDRDVYRIQLSDLATSQPITRDYIEYRDTSLRDTALADAKVTQATAAWNRIEGSDFAEVVILNSVHSFDDDTFNLRGGGNQVKYNELTRSINTTISVLEFVEDDLDADNTPVDTGLITAVTTFQDGAGNPLPGGGTHTATSYTAGNTVAAGSLRIAASQDAEDNVTFTGDTTKLFILGVSGATDNLITVTVGEDDVNSIVLTGYEFLLDGKSNDAYDMRVLTNVLGNLTLVDNATPDHDAILVRNDAINFNASGLNTIDLDNLSATLGGFNFDFDVLDVTNVTNSGLILNGGTNAAPANVDLDLTDEVVLGLLSRVTTINDFESMVLTEASLAGGTNFVFNPAANTLQQGSTSVTTSADILSFGGLVFEGTLRNSYVPDATTGVQVNVVGGVGAQVHGGDGADTITGGGAADIIRGNGGNDTLSGGLGTETREIQILGFLDNDASGSYVRASFNGYNVDVTEGVEIVEGAGSIAIGNALVAAINANISAINTGAAWTNGALVSASFDGSLLKFTFTAGANVLDGEAIVVSTNDALAGGIPFTASAETITEQGGDGGNDRFLFEPTKAENGADTINDFTPGDILDFTAYFAGTSSGTFGYYNLGAFVGTFSGNFTVLGFNKGTLAASDFNGPGDFVSIGNNSKQVWLTTADTDLVADATNNGWNAYYVYDSNPGAGITVNVELVGTINSPTEYFLAPANVAG